MRNNTSHARQLKEQILLIKEEFPTMLHKDIAKSVNCSKSTVNYYLTPGAAEKIKKRSGREDWRGVWRFVYEPKKKKKEEPEKTDTLLRKKFRAFLYGATRDKDSRRDRHMLKVKTTKIFHALAKLWPGITKEKQVFQAVNQWTGEKDYYDNGEPVLTPYARCKLTDKIINVKSNKTHCDHINGDRNDNSVENFSATIGWANQMKGDAATYKLLFERNEIIRQTLLKYKHLWEDKS